MPLPTRPLLSWLLPTLAVAIAIAVAGLGPAAAAQAAPPPPPVPRTLRVVGEGTTLVRPDVAVLVTGVEATGKDLAKVTGEANAKMKQILAALASLGIAEKDVQTLRNDIAVERPWDPKNGRPGPITGYTVNHEVRVKVRDLTKLGPAIDRVVAAGSNSLRSVGFEKEDQTQEQARALALAYAAARQKAEALARAAGATLGDPVSISESATRAPVFPVMRMASDKLAAQAEGAQPSAGEVEVSGTVEVVFSIR